MVARRRMRMAVTMTVPMAVMTVSMIVMMGMTGHANLLHSNG